MVVGTSSNLIKIEISPFAAIILFHGHKKSFAHLVGRRLSFVGFLLKFFDYGYYFSTGIVGEKAPDFSRGEYQTCFL